MNEAIAELIEQSGGTAILDHLYLPSEGGDRVGVRFGLGAELYMSEPDRTRTRERVLRVIEDYYRLFPDKLNRFLEDDHKRAREIPGDPTPWVRQDMERVPIEDGYSTLIFGMHRSSVKHDDVTPYSFSTYILRPDDADMSYVDAYFPVERFQQEKPPKFSELITTMLRWCEVCQPTHGSAGFSVLFTPGMITSNGTLALGMLKRFPGFGFTDASGFAYEARATHNRIKCVNWLTALNDGIVDEIGGIAAMRVELEPVCKVHEYAGGVLIQAGEVPQLGDTHRQVIPEAYRMVARYTKPVRFEGYRSGLFQVPRALDELDETLAWIRRFD